MDEAQLAIRRFTVTVDAPAESAQAVARRADTAVRTLLADRLSACATTAGGDNVLLLRSVDIDLTMDATESASVIADRIARALAAAIDQAAASPAAFPGYPSRSAQVASFLAALLDGRAWNGWQFRGFDGVRLLPCSVAIRTVLLRDPVAMPKIWAAMAPDMRERTIARLTGNDAHILAEALATPGARKPAANDWVVLAAALRDSGPSSPESRALAALVDIAIRDPESISSALVAAARAAALLIAGATSPIPRSIWKSLPASGQGAAVLPEALLRALTGAPDPGADLPSIHWRYSRLGGYALLLSTLTARDLTAADSWPSPHGVPPSSLLMLAIVAAAAGPRDGRALIDDPFWRTVFDLPARLSRVDISEWLAAADAPAWRTLVPPGATPPARDVRLPAGLGNRRARSAVARIAGDILLDLARRLPGFAGSSPAFLRTNLLGAGASIIADGADVRIRFDRPPLDVLLAITSIADCTLPLPGGRTAILERRR